MADDEKTPSGRSSWFSGALAKTKQLGSIAAASAGSAMKEGYTYAKNKAMKVQETEEPQEFKDLMERLQKSEAQLHSLLKAGRALLRAQEGSTRSKSSLAGLLLEGDPDANFNTVLKDEGGDVQKLAQLETKLVADLQERVIAPLEALIYGEVTEMAGWRKEYRVAKMEYDAAIAEAEKLKDTPGPKLDAANEKLNACTATYNRLQGQLRKACELIEAKKSVDVKRAVEEMRLARKAFYQAAVDI